MATLLVAGVPRSGKSTIARAISRGPGFSYFPVDALVSSLGKLHPEVGITHLTDNPQTVSRALSPLVVELHTHLNYERLDVVLDAYQCFPTDVDAAIRSAGRHVVAHPTDWQKAQRDTADTIGVVFVGYPSATVREKVAQIRRHAQPGDWSEDVDDASLGAIVERFVAESRLMATQCDALGWHFVDTYHDFDLAVSGAVAAWG